MATRSYTVGLPVTIEVDDDGQVFFTVSIGEASQAMDEFVEDGLDEGAIDDATLTKDMEAVDAHCKFVESLALGPARGATYARVEL